MKIAFICTGNSARSQIAEAIAKKLSKELNLNNIEIYSAGTKPTGYVNPMAIRILEENNVSAENLYSKSINDIPYNECDIIITVCDSAASECSNVKGKINLHWSLIDPFSYEQFYFIYQKLYQNIYNLLLKIKNNENII
ncbi:MAG: arsenate reductase ArsC [bacterium]|jgi:arsenate reductase